MQYGFSKTVDLTFEQAIEKVTVELQKEGFGVLTTIDVKETLKKKLNVELGRYVILGACNPPFAHKALTLEPEIGLLLPCNVIVYEEGSRMKVSIFNPLAMMELVENPNIRPIAEDVSAKLQIVLKKI